MVRVTVFSGPQRRRRWSDEERLEMVRRECAGIDAEIVVTGFNSLLMDFAESQGANVIIRGLRTAIAVRDSFGKLLAFNEHNAPLRRNITIEEVGNAAAFLLSDLASGITGEIMYVDAGFNITAIGNPEPF